MHVMKHLGEFHKYTRRGDFVKIFKKMCTKWSIFEKFYLFSNKRIRFIKITHIFSQNTSVKIYSFQRGWVGRGPKSSPKKLKKRKFFLTVSAVTSKFIFPVKRYRFWRISENSPKNTILPRPKQMYML